MTPGLDPLDLELLYGVALGFVGPANIDLLQRHALLSATGICGARSAALFRRTRGREFRLDNVRGQTLPADARLHISERLESLLLTRRAALFSELRWVRQEMRGLSAMDGIELLVASVDRDRLVAILALGPRIFANPYSERDLRLLADVGALTARAIYAPSITDGPVEAATVGTARRSTRRATSRADELRRRHPALAPLHGVSPGLVGVMEDILAFAPSDFPVLIFGETGVGKDLVARALHEQSPRRAASFETVNCPALPENLAESALFGHERGSFTGADRAARGHLELAGRGTLFLDEIGDFLPAHQAKLLLALERGEFRPVGSESPRRFEARIMAATHRNLFDEIQARRFREDLYYRLAALSLVVPPLRERPEDIPYLVQHFLTLHRREGAPLRAGDGFLAELARSTLQGNVRQLKWAVIRAMIRCGRGTRLHAEHLRDDLEQLSRLHQDAAPTLAANAPDATHPPSPTGAPDGPSALQPMGTYREMRRAYVMDVLRLGQGVVLAAARIAGIPPTTMHEYVREFDLRGFVAECRRDRRSPAGVRSRPTG